MIVPKTRSHFLKREPAISPDYAFLTYKGKFKFSLIAFILDE